MKEKTIRAFTDPYLESLLTTILAMDWRNPQVYGDFLAQNHYYISHTTRILAAAGARFDLSQEAFHLQCMKHAGEERSHEKLSLSDLAVVGYTVEKFPELPSTKALYRNAYYMIERMHPVTLFGYAYFLERVGMAGSHLEPILLEHYEKKAIKHISLHANEDPGHIETYEQMLNGFTGEYRAFLEEAIVTTAYHCERVCREVQERSGKQKQAGKKAA